MTEGIGFISQIHYSVQSHRPIAPDPNLRQKPVITKPNTNNTEGLNAADPQEDITESSIDSPHVTQTPISDPILENKTGTTASKQEVEGDLAENDMNLISKKIENENACTVGSYFELIRTRGGFRPFFLAFWGILAFTCVEWQY